MWRFGKNLHFHGVHVYRLADSLSFIPKYHVLTIHLTSFSDHLDDPGTLQINCHKKRINSLGQIRLTKLLDG